MEQPALKTFQLQHLVSDNEISERIGGQIMALSPKAYMKEKPLGDLMQLMITLMQKLQKAKGHVDRCQALTASAMASAGVPEPGVQHADHTTGVEAEVEAFLFQFKATLDVLCKFLRPTAGINLATFGDKGNKVVKALRGNVSDAMRPRADELVRLIENDQGWITPVINVRDSASHYGGTDSTGVRAERIDGKLVVTAPTNKHGEPFPAFVQTAYRNLLTFAEDCAALSLSLAMPAGLVVMVVGETERADLTKYKFGIGALNVPPPPGS